MNDSQPEKNGLNDIRSAPKSVVAKKTQSMKDAFDILSYPWGN